MIDTGFYSRAPYALFMRLDLCSAVGISSLLEDVGVGLYKCWKIFASSRLASISCGSWLMLVATLDLLLSWLSFRQFLSCPLLVYQCFLVIGLLQYSLWLFCCLGICLAVYQGVGCYHFVVLLFWVHYCSVFLTCQASFLSTSCAELVACFL